jgi:hypothetical protein
MDRPSYFERIRERASNRWDQLDADPELAGPWHQLFKQVQSPRHVVSELLQNADDAGATRASVAIEGDEFVFSHNGEDFTEEHFASLCRFGYSNKRALHTIGFRGVGFKSTFSLGDEVRLFSPTLSVAFRRKRFTEPIWIDSGTPQSKQTEVRVTIKDAPRRRELEKNLEEWFKSPASLLFFRTIRSLTIGDREVEWTPQGVGPINDSEWMALSAEPEAKYLLIRSTEEEFPEDALEEIRQERMLSVEEDTTLPPCRVELVLGLEGRLFVILPTGVKTQLPFACNAPFVQDPARVKIKDPETSATNQWLLKRVGELAATAMIGWLKTSDLPIEGRCQSYSLFPDVNREDNSLEGVCATSVEEAFESIIQNEAFLLCEDKQLVGWGECASLPATTLDIWTAEQAKAFFIEEGRSILSRLITEENRKKLIHWKCVQEVEKSNILDVLESSHLPKPARWKQLLALWEYVANDVTRYYYPDRKSLRIFPVRGKEVLYSKSEVVRVGEERLLKSDEDWEFLSKYLLVIDHNWPRFLAKKRRLAEEAKDKDLAAEVAAAYQVLTALGHKDASDVNIVIHRVAGQFFAEEEHNDDEYVKLAQIAANLGASVTEDFQFITRDDYLTAANQQVVADLGHDLDTFVDESWYEGHVLSDLYSGNYTSCTFTEWESWISSGKSRMLTFVPLVQKQDRIWNRGKLKDLLTERGAKQAPHFPYVTNDFVITDWDFDQSHWEHWETLAKEDETFWRRLLERIMKQPRDFWSKSLTTKISQVATTGTRQQVTQEVLLPSWIMKFRGLACLQDTWGNRHQPAELLRRTPETESLLDVEPFVKGEFDIEANRPLLISLGVRDTPTGPDRLLERLTTLSQIKDPPVIEVEKWYKRLDQMITKCSTEEMERIKSAFQIKRIILTENREWVRAPEVFINADEEDVPDAAVILSSVRHLSLWHKVNVAQRPTADLAIKWLQSLPAGQRLSQDEARRVRSLLPKYPERIWQECEHWLNLEGEWTPVSDLSYALTMQSLVPWGHLFKEFKQRVADFQKLPTEICQQRPFSDLPTLANSIEERFQEQLFQLPEPERKPWVSTLGVTLRRIILDNEAETSRVRTLAGLLSQTVWQPATGLEALPYIDGTPAGAARRIDVLWKDALLYVEGRSAAKLARAIAQELGRVFGRVEIIDAIKLCYERSPEFISEYLEENFKLLPGEILETSEEKVAKSHAAGAAASASESHQPEKEAEQRIEASEELAPQIDEVPDDDVIEEDFEDILDEEVTTPRRKQVKPPKPSLIERFASIKGYTKDGDERFFHSNGSFISKANGMRFPWELRSASGDLLQCYWLKDHCIQKEPLDVAAEIWNLCDKSPQKYSLVLSDEAGEPIEISGDKLKQMCDRDEITLHAATYRLVYETK